MKPQKSIFNYFSNNKFNMKQLIADYEPYIKTIINDLVNNNLSFEDKEEISSGIFILLPVLSFFSYLASSRIAPTIESVFHFTILSAEFFTIEEVFSEPHGSIAKMGFPRF